MQKNPVLTTSASETASGKSSMLDSLRHNKLTRHLTALIASTQLLIASACSNSETPQPINGDASETGDTNTPANDVHDSDSHTNPDVTDPAKCEDQPELIRKWQALSNALESCATCHVEGGAGEKGWIRYIGEDPVKIQQSFNLGYNLNTQTTDDGESLFLAIPQLNALDSEDRSHLGGKQTITPHQQILAEDFSLAVQNNETNGNPVPLVNEECINNEAEITQEDVDKYFEGATLLDDTGVLSKWKIRFGSKMTAQKVGSPQELAALLRKDTNENENFARALADYMNDFTKTRQFAEGNQAIEMLEEQYGIDLSGVDNAEAADSIQNLFTYIVLKNKPITDILMADYMVVPAPVPANQIDHDSPLPRAGWTKRLKPIKPNAIPLAGMFGDRTFHEAHPTTDTNIGRNKARLVEMFALNKDVFKVYPAADRSLAEGQANPQSTNGACVTCHYEGSIDPVAAALDQWHTGEFDLTPDPTITETIVYTGYEGKTINSKSPTKVRELMNELIKTDEFYESMGAKGFEILMERPPVDAPKAGEFGEEAKSERYKIEQFILKQAAKTLKENGGNFREMLIQLADTPFFRATGGAEAGVSEDRAIALEMVGPGLVTPEILTNRLVQLFGQKAVDMGLAEEVLVDGVVDLGGIDNQTVKNRRPDPTGAFEIRLGSVAFNSIKAIMALLAEKGTERGVFRLLDETQAPLVVGSNEKINEDMYRATLREIQLAAFGENVGTHSPEIDEAYERLLEFYKAFVNNPGSGEVHPEDRVEGLDPSDKFGLKRMWAAYFIEMITSLKFTVTSPKVGE